MIKSFENSALAIVLSVHLLLGLSSCSENPVTPAKPTLVVEPTRIKASAACGVSIGGTEIEVSSSNGDTILVIADKSKPWVTLNPASDSTPATFFVNFNVGGLDIGKYTDTIVFSSPQADNTVKVVVRLVIGSEMEVSPTSLVFHGLRSFGNPQPQSFVLTGTCPSGYNFILTESAPWLALSSVTGTAPDTIDVSVDIAGLPTGIYTEIITVDASQAVNAPQQVACTLTVSSWLPQENPYQQDLQGVTFIDELRGWAVGIDNNFPERTGYLLATTDGGQNWTLQRTAVDSSLGDIVFVDTNTGWAVGSGGYVIHTTDGGLSWTKQNTGVTEDLWGVTFVDTDTGWVVGRDGIILRTTNGGTTWEIQFSQPDKIFSAVTFVDTRHGWVVGNAATILHTSNGGETWVSQNAPVYVDFRDVYFSDANTGWIVGAQGTILHTTDSGNTWTALTTDTDLQLFGLTFIASGHGWAVGEQGTILYTEDGVTWTLQVSGTSTLLFDVYFVNDNLGWAVGENGLIIHTVSGGQ
jgi:photosystem II stability/assembly factor-like uncharacterized protein